MSLPHALLVARLKGLSAVSAIVGTRVYPIIPPQGVAYPCVVYQVIDNEPENLMNGTTDSCTMRVRVSALSLTSSGEQGYTNAWTLAEAIIGDCDTTPSGLSGWQDSDGNIWHLEASSDEAGEIITGTDQYEAFIVNMLFTVQYNLAGD